MAVAANELRELVIPPPDKLFKVLIVGDPTVGKTSYVQRYVQNTYKRDYKGTVGVDFALKVVKWSDTQNVKLQLWDIAGQERFTWMTRVYYKDSHGCLIMFDLANRNTFDNTIKWKNDVNDKLKLDEGRGIPCVLIANKCDIPENDRKVSSEEIKTMYKDHNFDGWTETSAKDGTMVEDSMRFLIQLMMNREEGLTESPRNVIKLEGPGAPKKKCC